MPAPASALARNPLFEGVSLETLERLAARMRPRRLEPGAVVCRAGDPGDSLFLILDGLARVTLPDGDGSRVVARLRRGDVIGEMSLVTGEPRSATVAAAVPTTVLELARDDFAATIADDPRLLANLNRILSRRLAETTARVGERRGRGEAVALLVGEAGARLVPDVLAATEAASARPVASLDARESVDAPLGALDDLLSEHGTVVVVASLAHERTELLVEAVDRAVALVSVGEEVGEGIEAFGVDVDIAWLGRHLSRTKLGLALGAGGAKGYAHVGALHALERAGYTVDAVAGSSIGAIVGAWLALGKTASEVEAAMREAFRPEIVDEVFKLSLTGGSTGLETHARVLREYTEDKTFADCLLPLVVMTVDLNARDAAPVREGPLWEALVAATALAGLFPPHERDGQRLVDGLALVPVPVDAVVAAGADVTVSVNIISRDTLPAWPGDTPEPEQPRAARSRMLDTLLEVMDLTQLDSSERHAGRADVVVTPRFGPGSWRDFHLADLFLEAGVRAAEEQLPALRELARPQLSSQPV
jgi:NTE family protein